MSTNGTDASAAVKPADNASGGSAPTQTAAQENAGKPAPIAAPNPTVTTGDDPESKVRASFAAGKAEGLKASEEFQAKLKALDAERTSLADKLGKTEAEARRAKELEVELKRSTDELEQHKGIVKTYRTKHADGLKGRLEKLPKDFQELVGEIGDTSDLELIESRLAKAEKVHGAPRSTPGGAVDPRSSASIADMAANGLSSPQMDAFIRGQLGKT